MLSAKIEAALNNQIRIEAQSSQTYLAMAVWAETQGLDGIAGFMYRQSDEERMHMLKLVRFVNERGGKAHISELKAPDADYSSFKEMFEKFLEHEIAVSASINKLAAATIEASDFATHNFVQWFITEQIEEEALARTILDKINLIGTDKGGLYLFDRDIETLKISDTETGN